MVYKKLLKNNILAKSIFISLLVLFVFVMVISIVGAKAPPNLDYVTGLKEITVSQNYINWTWTDPTAGNVKYVSVYLNGTWQENIPLGIKFYNKTNLVVNTEYTIGIITLDKNFKPVNATFVNDSAKTAPDTIPPKSITDLNNVSYAYNYIYWTWTDPTDPDFSNVSVYLNGTFYKNVTKGDQYFNATGLTYDTEYQISTRTIDLSGNVNQTWVNRTARTAPDNLPPITKIILSGDLKTSGWYASFVGVNLTATDDISGINKIEYRLNIGEWTTYSEPFQVIDQGGASVEYRSIDNAGNVELSLSDQINIDTVPPVISINNVIDKKKYNTSVTPEIIIYDYSFDVISITLNGLPYSSTQISDEGEYILNVSVSDKTSHNANNSTRFSVDRTPPPAINELKNVTSEPDHITWTWTDPVADDLSYVKVYIDEVFKMDILRGTQFYSVMNLSPETEYTISTLTVDDAGNINQTWVNHTARTSPTPPPPMPCISSCGWTVNYIVS